MSVVIQGRKIAAEASEIRLPDGDAAKVIELEGRLPEVELRGDRFLGGLDGTLYPRTLNTTTGHAGFSEKNLIPPPSPKKKSHGDSRRGSKN